MGRHLGTEDNKFTIDFVTISGDSGDLGNWPAGNNYTFTGVNHGAYRMGKYEITNQQWFKFLNEYGAVIGNPAVAYDEFPNYMGLNLPTNNVSWFEAAQFVNWLNTSTNHTPAYKFTGTQGTSGYTFAVWEPSDAGYDAGNPYRSSNAYYFLPNEEEWVKAAYWNRTSLQTWATVGNIFPTKGDWNAYDNGYVWIGPWDVGSGGEELNGTFDMMGNVWEWMESPYVSGNYLSGCDRGIRGASCFNYMSDVSSNVRYYYNPNDESGTFGFRVASVPEPCTVLLLGLGGLMIRKKEKGKRKRIFYFQLPISNFRNRHGQSRTNRDLRGPSFVKTTEGRQEEK